MKIQTQEAVATWCLKVYVIRSRSPFSRPSIETGCTDCYLLRSDITRPTIPLILLWEPGSVFHEALSDK